MSYTYPVPWFRHSPTCDWYLVDGACDCEELVAILGDDVVESQLKEIGAESEAVPDVRHG
jgi:hypothetical protein